MLKKGKLVDLSWTLMPGKEQRLLEVETIDSASVTGASDESRGQGWYIMTNIEIVSHQGTHIEVPYHAIKQGKDLAAFEPERSIGAWGAGNTCGPTVQGGYPMEIPHFHRCVHIDLILIH